MATSTEDRLLAPGLKIDGQLLERGIGREGTVIDERCDLVGPIKLSVRELPGKEHQSWHDEFQKRLRMLAGVELPYVLLPREIGRTSDGNWYLLQDPCDERLSAKIQARRGIQPDEAVQIIDDLLTALAALHSQGIPHGDIRPKNVFLRYTQDGKTTTAWLGETVVGGLAWWSNGDGLADSEARCFWPPEWQGVLHAPSFQADLYALGLLAGDLLLGTENNPARQATEGVPVVSKGSGVKAALRTVKADPALCRLISILLQDAQRRPTDATRAKAAWRTLRMRYAWWRWHAAAGVLIVLMLVLGLFSRKQVADLEAQKYRLKADLDKTTSDAREAAKERDAAKTRLAETEKQLNDANPTILSSKGEPKRLNQRIAQLEGVLSKQRPPIPIPPWIDVPDRSPQDVAEKLWKNALEDLKLADDPLEAKIPSMRFDAAEIAKHFPPDKSKSAEQQAEVRKLLNGWRTKLAGLQEQCKRWRACDPWATDSASSLVQLFKAACRDPGTRYQALKEQMDMLKKAEQVWKIWADDGLEPRDIPGEIAAQDGKIKEALAHWWQELRSTADWKLALDAGKAPAGNGTTRLIWVNEKELNGGDTHDWTSETSNAYGGELIPFSWRPGEKITLSMEGQRLWLTGGYRPYLISPQFFSGALAIWQLNRNGEIRQGQSSLTFRVLKCPGPPRPEPIPDPTERLGDD